MLNQVLLFEINRDQKEKQHTPKLHTHSGALQIHTHIQTKKMARKKNAYS